MAYSCKMLLILLSISPLFGEATKEEEKKSPKENLLCPKYYRHKDAPTIFVKAGYLYQKIYTEGVNIAWQQTSPTNNLSVARPTFGGANGYTIEVQGSAERDGWIASAAYFYLLYSPALTENRLVNNPSYTPNFANSPPTYSNLSSRYDMTFNRVDLQLFRPSYTGYFMDITPKIGLSGAWDTSYLTYFALTQIPEVQKATYKQQWFGIGPCAATEISMCIIDPLFLTLCFDGAIFLTSHTNTNNNYSYKNSSLVNEEAINYSHYTFVPIEPNIRTSLGIKVEKIFPYWSFSFAVDWQLSHYFSHTFFPKYYSPTGVCGDLSMQGLATSLEIGF